MLHALVRGGQVVETRNVDPVYIPQHKRSEDGGLLLRPLIDDGLPNTFDHALHTYTQSYEITLEQVRVVYTIADRPPPPPNPLQERLNELVAEVAQLRAALEAAAGAGGSP